LLHKTFPFIKLIFFLDLFSYFCFFLNSQSSSSISISIRPPERSLSSLPKTHPKEDESSHLQKSYSKKIFSILNCHNTESTDFLLENLFFTMLNQKISSQPPSIPSRFSPSTSTFYQILPSHHQGIWSSQEKGREHFLLKKFVSNRILVIKSFCRREFKKTIISN